jgi:hypothetical protein
MKTLDSLDSHTAQAFAGHELVDENGDSVGKIDGFWFDPSTHRVAFVGVKTGGLSSKVNALPARDLAIDERGNLLRLRHRAAFIRKSPIFDPKVELSEVAKEEINAYYGRWMPNERVTSIQEVRPEEALPQRGVIKESTNRSDLEGDEQAFFKEKGFVTDSFPEVDASEALERTQKEAKSRNRADREKRGDLD